MKDEIDEVEHVDQCPINGCDMRFIGATPDDVREHMTDEHGQMAELIVFPIEDLIDEPEDDDAE